MTAARVVRVASFAAAFGAVHDAWGLDTDVLDFSVIASERYDSNIFRLPDDVQPFGNGRASATTRTLGVGLRLDKTYSQQTFNVDATVTRDHYSPYHFLDATGRTVRAAWLWTLTPSITGNLSINQSQIPNNFIDSGLQTQSNQRKTEERRFDIAWRPGAALHPRFAFLDNEDRSDIPTFERQNSRTLSVESAIVYEFRSGNSAETYYRRGRGSYLNFDANPVDQTDAQFTESEAGVGAHWRSTGTSTFDGRLGYLDRSHRNFASRNFKGLVGSLGYTYAPTGKIQLRLDAVRTLSSTQTFISSYSEDESLAISPVYFATSKIAIRPTYTLTRRLFKGALLPSTRNLDLVSHDFTFRLDWAVFRSLDVSAAYLRSTRSANDLTYQYHDRGGLISGTFRF